MMEGIGIVMKGLCLLVGQIVVYGGGALIAICWIGQAVMDWKARRGKG